VLTTLDADLQRAAWWSPTWLEEVFRTVGLNIEAACDRWRGLYRAALAQYALQSRIVADASRPAADKNEAKKLRREAEAQLDLLTAVSGASSQSDFYAYRYFANRELGGACTVHQDSAGAPAGGVRSVSDACGAPRGGGGRGIAPHHCGLPRGPLHTIAECRSS
jgi:hypothetical protein